MVMCTLGRGLHCAVFSSEGTPNGTLPIGCTEASGGEGGRRLWQHIWRWCHDATNAYYAVQHPAILECIDSCYAPQDRTFIRVIIIHNAFLLRARVAVFPGDTGATQLSCRTCSEPVLECFADLT
eukprot:2216162-Pyramimonas_sp.AAC.1